MKKKNIKYISISVLVIAICMIAFGAANGEVGVIFTKAINICLQCMGLR